MSDPSGGNLPPGGGGKGSNVPGGSSGGATPTVADQPIGGESLPDPDEWGSASDSSDRWYPGENSRGVRSHGDDARANGIPVQPAANPPPKAIPRPSATIPGDAPAINAPPSQLRRCGPRRELHREPRRSPCRLRRPRHRIRRTGPPPAQPYFAVPAPPLVQPASAP